MNGGPLQSQERWRFVWGAQQAWKCLLIKLHMRKEAWVFTVFPCMFGNLWASSHWTMVWLTFLWFEENSRCTKQWGEGIIPSNCQDL